MDDLVAFANLDIDDLVTHAAIFSLDRVPSSQC